VLVLAALLLLAAASPTAAATPEAGLGGDPVPDASTAPPALVAVLDLLKQGDAVGALEGVREFVNSEPASALGHEVHGIAAMANRLGREAPARPARARSARPGAGRGLVPQGARR